MKKTLVKKANPEEAKGEHKFKVKGVDKKQLSLLEKGKLPLSALAGLIAGAGVSYAFSFIDGEAIEDPAEEKSDDSDTYTYEFEAPTTISFSNNVNDSMSFGQAFRTARADTGSGGFFNWRGNSYHTLTKEEWDSLSDEEKKAYLEDIREHIDFKEGEHNKVDPDNDDDTTPDNDDDDTTPDDEFSNIDEVIDEEDLIEDLNEEDFIEETDGIDGGIDQENEDNEIEYDDDFADDLLKKTNSNLDETDLDL